jgi:hypothetical protein
MSNAAYVPYDMSYNAALSLTSVLEGDSIWAPKTERGAVDVFLLPEGRLVEGPGSELTIN